MSFFFLGQKNKVKKKKTDFRSLKTQNKINKLQNLTKKELFEDIYILAELKKK